MYLLWTTKVLGWKPEPSHIPIEKATKKKTCVFNQVLFSYLQRSAWKSPILDPAELPSRVSTTTRTLAAAWSSFMEAAVATRTATSLWQSAWPAAVKSSDALAIVAKLQQAHLGRDCIQC